MRKFNFFERISKDHIREILLISYFTFLQEKIDTPDSWDKKFKHINTSVVGNKLESMKYNTSMSS